MIGLILSRRWGLILVGIVLVVIGLVTGASSHQVSYKTVSRGTITHYLYGQTDSGGDANNDAYIQLQGGSLFFLNESDFTPMLNSDALQGDLTTLVYDPSDTKDIDADSSNTTTHLVGTGDSIVQLTSFDDNGQNPKVFTTSEYAQHPNGFYSNNWPTGIVLLVIGLLICGAMFMIPAKRKQTGFSMTPPMGGVPPMGSVPNGYAPPNAYQPPYQNPNQYPPQGGGYPQYPGAAPYGQPQQPPNYPGQPQQGPNYPGQQPPNYPPAPGPYGSTQYGSPYDAPRS